ncbi:protein N-terminal glutamine amidohydrolase [Gadus chalcogrammus]|uniref:protein N-terminal glutamine amidohydrolase n=1 Tax=Gadus chalcogrammus TaxID=1042646 RepID=UPI0024C28562|nr:protein N-terminal glutamine amidohydrolase [Gadus chalcogrammus]
MQREGYQSITSSRDSCVYTSCYCEENVWKLCEFVNAQTPDLLREVYAVFISNERRTVPLWKQKSGPGNEPVIWDYHVILLHKSSQWGQSFIYDLDSVLDCPCDLQLYAEQAFRSDKGLKPAFWRKVRVIPAKVFLKTFASDRSHMKQAGVWQKPPPPYPCIQTPDSVMNLDDFISMNPRVGVGNVFSLPEFIQHFTVNL